MTISPLAGKPAPKEMLIDLARLEREYFDCRPDLDDPEQRVAFGTSGHRGSPFRGSFTRSHILAITQAICDYRCIKGTGGPLYMGKDTHALSRPAQCTALEVLAANKVQTVIQQADGVTPTPVISLSTTARALSISPTALSSPPRITRPRMAASSTIRHMEGRRIPTSPNGSRTGPMNFCGAAIPA
jgi:alpha-D-glucose phosphate-specific phosphoglucomutase